MATEYGNRLRAARKHAGLTQEQLRDKTGIAQSTISSAERDGQGSSETPVYAKACGVSALWLATGEGEMVPMELAAQQAGVFTYSNAQPDFTAPGIAIDVKARAPIIRPQAMGSQVERRLTRFLAVLFQLPEAERDSALVAATELLLDRLPPPPSV